MKGGNIDIRLWLGLRFEDLVSLLRELINRQKDNFILHGIFPKWDIAEQCVYVLTDRKWNSLLLEQLLSNAIKYTSGRQDTKEVSFRMERERERVRLIVTDTGIGIPEYDLSRVWEPFFTGENGRKVRSATGLGLYIVRSIAEHLNHPVALASTAGRGTTVTVDYQTLASAGGTRTQDLNSLLAVRHLPNEIVR